MDSIGVLTRHCRPILVALVLCLPLFQDAFAQSQEQVSTVRGFQGLVIDVIKGAAEWGIEEAGVRVLGPTVWKLVKAVIKPVMPGLQARFPELFGTKFAQTDAARAAAARAVHWAENDADFRAAIAQQLQALGAAQRELLALAIETRDLSRRSFENTQLLIKKVEFLQRQQTAMHKTLITIETRVQERVPEAGQDWFALANSAKNADDKIRWYTQAISQDRNRLQAYFQRGLVYFDQRDFNSAHADFDRVVQLDRSFAAAYTNRGASSGNLGRTAAAIADYRTSLELDPTLDTSYENLYAIYSAQKSYADVYAVLKRKLRYGDPNIHNATLYGRLAWYALFNREFRNAIDYARKGIAMDSAATWIETNLAHAYLFTEQPANAERIYFKHNGIKLSGVYWEELLLKDFEELEQAGVVHQKMNALRASLYGNLSYYVLFERRFEESAAYARRGLEFNPGATWIYTNLAHSHLFSGQFNKASEIYNQYLGKQVNDRYWEQVVLEDFDALRNSGITSQRVNDVSVIMYSSLSWHLLLGRQFEHCIEAAGNAIKLDQRYLVPYTNLAHCYLLTGRHDAARNIYVRYKDEYIGEKRWQDVIRDDFRFLNSRGIFHPNMQQILGEMN